MATITLKNVRKDYGRNKVIHGVSLDVSHGEFIVVVGPSGCGKSTLLRMVAGLEEITSGTIEIGGRIVNKLEPRERDIAMVFQNYALYPHMTVFQNMAYGLKNAGKSRSEIAVRVGNAAKMLELAPYLDRKPRALSGGQRQRVAMGRALVRDPAAFLFDEPLSNLDAKLRVQMRLEIKALQRSVGTTSIYVTHDQVEAMTLADRLVVMNAGIAEQTDTPMHVYRKPASVFVAGFIGSPAMNILEAHVGVDGKSIAIRTGVGFELPEKSLPPAGAPLLFGVRPEHVGVVSEERADLTLRVAAVETLGADTLAHCRMAITDKGSDFVVRVPGTTTVHPGQQLPVAFDRTALHFFDVKTKNRLSL